MNEKERIDAENLRTVYAELCTSYHAIADFRAKLLGFLPLASGAGIFLFFGQQGIKTQTLSVLISVGLFGFLVTLGLFTYELRGIQRCNALIEAGKDLENKLGFDGQFKLRPKAISGVIGTTLAARMIYPAVLAAFLFIALLKLIPEWVGGIVAALIFIGGMSASFSLPLHPTLEELKRE